MTIRSINGKIEMIQEEKKEKWEEEEELTEQEKALVRKDLALCLKLNAKLGNYQNRSAVQKIYDWVAMEPRFHTVIGKRYVKRLGDILEGETDFADCVLCNGFMIDGTAVCEDCLNKYRNLIPQSADTKEQTGNGTVQKMTAISERAADTARQMSASAKEKLQNNPEAARAMEKGKEQVKKAQGKWRGMSRKKRIVIAAVCALLLLGGMSGASGKSGSGGGSIKTESAEDAMQLAQTLYPETKGYSLTAGGKTTYSASDLQNDRSKKSIRAMFNLRVGESLADQDAVTEAYQKTDFSQDFTYYYVYIYKGYDHLKDCMISEDGRVVEVAGGSYIRVR